MVMVVVVVGGGVKREMLEIKRKNGMLLGRVLRYPRRSWFQPKFLNRLTVSIRVAVPQSCGLSVSAYSGLNIHKEYTFFT